MSLNSAIETRQANWKRGVLLLIMVHELLMVFIFRRIHSSNGAMSHSQSPVVSLYYKLIPAKKKRTNRKWYLPQVNLSHLCIITKEVFWNYESIIHHRTWLSFSHRHNSHRVCTKSSLIKNRWVDNRIFMLEIWDHVVEQVDLQHVILADGFAFCLVCCLQDAD